MRMRSRVALVALAFMLGAGCPPARPPVTVAAGQHRVAVAYVVDYTESREVTGVPASVASDVGATLRERRLAVADVPEEQYLAAFATRRLTQHRLSQLAARAEGSDVVLLIEAYPRFYSLLQGRYRWTVQWKVTVARKDALEAAVSADVQAGAFMNFPHEREREALAYTSNELTRVLGRVLDDFLPTLGDGAGGESGAAPASAFRSGEDVIYFVLVDRFANGDRANDGEIDPQDPAAWHGGDLAGLIARLDELHELGVRTIWISPIFRTRYEKLRGNGAFHGYWVEDLGQVDPRFGTVEELRQLSDELHRRGMRLVLDVVLNHVGYDTRLVTERPDWFHGRGRIENWNDPEQLVMNDVHGLPDLAQEREDVYRFLLDHSLRWIDAVRPDGFRLDAVKHMPVEFWARYNRDVRAHAGERFMLLGEVLDGDPRSLRRYFDGGEFTHLFDFPLHFATIDVFCKDRSPARLATILSGDRHYADPSRLVTLLDNHDLPRLATICGGERDRIEQALLFQMSARGTPSLTYGTEIGLEGEDEPENRADMRFEDHPLKGTIRELLAMRRASPALHSGATRLLSVDDETLAYARIAPSEAALVIVHRGSGARRVDVPRDLAAGATLRDARTGETIAGPAIDVAARSVRVVRIVPGSTDALAEATRAARETPAARSVRVVAEGAPMQTGDTLVLVGSAPELGDWDPARGVPFERDGAALVATPSLPAGSAFGLKLAIRRANGTVAWQDGDDRLLFVPAPPADAAMTLRW